MHDNELFDGVTEFSVRRLSHLGLARVARLAGSRNSARWLTLTLRKFQRQGPTPPEEGEAPTMFIRSLNQKAQEEREAIWDAEVAVGTQNLRRESAEQTNSGQSRTTRRRRSPSQTRTAFGPKLETRTL